MSEYQYYEFQAVDRTLTDGEMRQLRAVSTRAEITPSCFVNFYTGGDFKGNPTAWMKRYFDAFLYLANWGTHQLMLRLPRELLDSETARLYCRGGSARARAAGDFTILEFYSEDEEPEDVDDGSGWFSSLISLRAELANGNHRWYVTYGAQDAWLRRVRCACCPFLHNVRTGCHEHRSRSGTPLLGSFGKE